MATKTISKKAPAKAKATKQTKTSPAPVNKSGGIELYLKRIFALMFGAVGITAITTFLMLWLTQFGGGLLWFIGESGVSWFYYALAFGGLAFSLWVQAKVFSMKPIMAILMLFIYSIMIGMVITPTVWLALSVSPVVILQAFVIAALMFACMALFGYKTNKNLSFLGIFLQMGMIGLILVGVFSIFWPLGSVFATIVCLIGVLVFALFTAYDMQFLKRAYASIEDDTQKNQLAVLGALHLYIAFVAMFNYILNLLNLRN